MGQLHPESPVGIDPHDLIDDRALSSEDDDAFRLRDVADEVAALCTSVPVPATLALYGSWGSGKSSLANLLDSHFANDRKIAFARFDAFKYAELPLRRHFLSQLATEFGINGKFKEGLYESRNEVRLKRKGWWMLVVIVVIAALGMMALAALASVAIAIAAKGGFRSHFASAWRASVPGVVLAIPLVATVIGLVAKYVTVDTKTDAPSSDEQFERLFKELVAKIKGKARCDRIVVFIDELDRCSAKEVVSALETLRTFLEVSPCIFIVAADQQALERALTDAARQETPFNSTNPYYSAGSAYLDKIFQYQLPLPPILARRLSRFALDLIKGRQGVWLRVPNRAELVSVLIPTHVHSPRRVKALLNSFALLFRLALRRSSQGLIDEQVEMRASEIAKLVCLKTEFPLFADDLQLDHRLPDLVLRIYEAEQPDDDDLKRDFLGLSPEALARARDYAGEKLAVAEVIAQESVPATSGGTGLSTDKRVREVEKSQAKQLIRYLEKTREITSPGKDVIYLESSGAAFDLPSELAEQLEQDAVNGRADVVAETLDELDEPEQEKVYRLLAWLIVESLGIEARNVVRSLFRALSSRKGDLAPVAGDLLNALVTYNAGYELESDDLHGALVLAFADDGDAAQQMRSTVLERDEAIDDDDLGLLILEYSSELGEYPERLGEVFSVVLDRGKGAEAAEALSDVADREVEHLVEAVDLEQAGVVQGLGAFVEEVHPRREALAIKGLTKLVSTDSGEAADAARDLIEAFRPVTDDTLARSILDRTRSRPASEWPSWLGPLDPDVVQRFDSQWASEIADDYLRRLWQARFASSPEISDEEFIAGARELGRLRPAQDEEREMVDLLEGSTITSQGESPVRQQQHMALWELAEAGALDPEASAASILADLGRTLVSTPPADGSPAPTEHVVSQMGRALRETQAPELVRAFAKAAEDSSWFNGIELEIARLRSACALETLEPDGAPAPKQATLDALVSDGSDLADRALAEWLRTFNPLPTKVYRTLKPRVADRQRLEDPLLGAIGDAAPSWSGDAKADLLEAITTDYIADELDDAVVRALGLAEADDERASEILINNYEGASNNDERQRLLALWALVSPASDSANRKLINRIYLPLLGEGKGATKIALDHFDLVRNPPTNAARERLKKAIADAVAGDQGLSKRADRLLKDAGWISGKRRWLKW